MAADDADAAQVRVRQLDELLRPHTRREELGIFAQLRHEVLDDEYVATFEHDHELIDRLLLECAGDDWKLHVAELLALLQEHILREETDLFPAAHQMLEPARWRAVDEAVGAIVH